MDKVPCMTFFLKDLKWTLYANEIFCFRERSFVHFFENHLEMYYFPRPDGLKRDPIIDEHVRKGSFILEKLDRYLY